MRIFTHLYEVLGLDPEQEVITQQEVKEAYKAKAKVCHPDKEGGSAEAMAEVNLAWQILGDPNLRAKYDATGDGDKAPERVEIPGIHLLHELFTAVIQPDLNQGMASLAGKLGMDPSSIAGIMGFRNFERVDLIVEMKKLAKQGKQHIEAQIKEHEKKAQYFEKLAAKLSRKKGAKGPDVFVGMIKARAASHTGSAESGKNNLAEVDAVLGLLDTYNFDFTPQAQGPVPAGGVDDLQPGVVIIDSLGRLEEEMFQRARDEYMPYKSEKSGLSRGYDYRAENDRHNRKRPK